MVNLNQCVPGQKLLSKHGMILAYVGKTEPGNYYDHYVQYPDGGHGTRTNDGFTYRNADKRMPADHDIIDIMPLLDTAENRLRHTVFIVEATSFERLTLWQQHAHNSPHFPEYPKFQWEQFNPGWMVQVGKVGKRPVNLNVQWVKINGYLVMFYEGCSQVIDHKQIGAWLEKHFTAKWDNGTRRACCDAMNFGHCIAAIRELDSK